jgi:fructuronate reductase
VKCWTSTEACSLTDTVLTPAQLSPADLPRLKAQGLNVPAYARAGLTPGVVHLGLGAFHRAHQALVFDRLLASGDTRWGIFGVAMRNPELADALAAQGGLYALQIASRDGVAWQVCGALLQTAVAAREPEQVIAAIAAPATRWVTLTVTEKGYVPALAVLLVQGLARRHAAGLPGLTVASCDNLTGNGRQLEALCLDAARAVSAALAAWVQTQCAFPNSMVDRIVPAATPARLDAARQALGVADAGALGTEGFTEWVLERRFADPSDEQALTSVGVTVVDDVRPFEDAKLRLLNGSHSAMAYIGAVAGLPVIAQCIAQPVLHRLVHGLMTHEIGPHLSRQDWPAYRDALLARFANPELKHSVHQIATDGSKKILPRWTPPALDLLQHGQSFERLAFAAAAWMRYCLAEDEQGQPYAINDPLSEQLQALARTHASDAAATAQALGTLTSVWGDALPRSASWLTAVTTQLERIRSHGMLKAAALLP